MSAKWSLSRRTMLRGLGTAIALPMLDAMVPGGVVQAASSAGEAAAGAAGASVGSAPVRMAFVFTPNGINLPYFQPGKVGAITAADLPPTLAPLKNVYKQITVLSGLAQDNARSKGDGAGDHARSAAAFLTGLHPYKTAGANIRLGTSVDQVAAEKIGGATRLPSIELGMDKGQTAGQCDSGYSCAYVTNISWRSRTQPMPKVVDPAELFERLFGSADERDPKVYEKKLKYRKSILDFVAEDTRRLDRELGKSDHQKLEEFTTSIREIEKRVEAAQKLGVPKTPDMTRPEGIPQDFQEHMRLMYDLLALAFQMDVTRIGTVMVAREGSNRQYPWLGVKEGHHTMSHHGGKAEKIEAIRKIDRFHMEQFAYFVEKLAGMKEGDGTVLDNCMVLAGSGICDGNRHNHDNLPIMMAGGGGGLVTPGRHVTYSEQTPLCNLYLSMLDRVGVRLDRFGDSTGRLTALTA